MARRSLWDVFRCELKDASCAWCGERSRHLYEFEDEHVCQECLQAEEYEEPEYGLTLEERNR